MLFKKGAALFATEIERRQGENVLYINYLGSPFSPSLSENHQVMARTIDSLAENSAVSRLVFVQQRNYSYPSDQILQLAEIARLYNFLAKQEEILSPRKLAMFGTLAEVHEDLRLSLIHI